MTTNMSTKIELWSIDRLVPYARNARQHSNEQIARIAASMREFGFTNPILVDSSSGIVAGHARLAAARSLSLRQVPVIVLDHLSEAQKRAYLLADNKLAENASWDEDMLRVELESLAADDFDLSLTGFSDLELETLLGNTECAALIDEDELPPQQIRITSRTGDVWMLGPHRLVCGDALDPRTFDTLLSGHAADIIFTDPPYNVDYQAKTRGIANDNLGSGFAPFLEQVCRNLLASCRGAVYICMSSSELATLQQAFTRAGGHSSTFVIWAKNTFTLGRSDYQRQYEPILYGWKAGASHFWCGDRDQGDVWSVAKPVVNDLHPTMKPVELVERAIRNSSRPGDLVLDAFAGSGSTLIACERLDRRARLIELEPNYVDVIVRRWQEFTGRSAVLAGDGASFAAVCEQRAGAAPDSCPVAACSENTQVGCVAGETVLD
jgi:DNA modification methylase